MLKKNLFKFKSITHRLIFGCIVAAIIIYGFSYSQARLLVKKIIIGWMLEGIEPRVQSVVNEIEGQLSSIERSGVVAISIIQNERRKEKDSLTILQTLIQQETKIETIAIIDMQGKKDKDSSVGWLYNRTLKAKSIKLNESNIWLKRCKITSSKIQPFWTEPYPLNNKTNSLAITYCSSIISSSDNSRNISLLAIEVNLDWLTFFMKQNFTQSNALNNLKLEVPFGWSLVNKIWSVKPDFNYLKIGQPFIISSVNKIWIVKPSEPQRVQSSFLEENINLDKNEKNYQFVNSQGTLIGTKIYRNNWVVGIVFPAAELEKFDKQYHWLLIVSMSKDMLLMCLVIAMITRLTTKPLRALIKSTEKMAYGNFNTKLPEVTSVDEVGRLTQSFQKMQIFLLNYIDDLQKTTAIKQKLESEISLAAQIQRTMLPRINVTNVGKARYEVSALLKPALVVGGDFYDFFLLSENSLCLIIGDVAGKGFPAALLMARTITLIRTLTRSFSSASEILSSVNKELCIDNEECQFVTLFCGILNLESGVLCYSSAGHDPPLLLQKSRVTYLELETGSPLGLYEGAIFEQKECLLEDNDLILLYTDGITEAMNLEGEIFSEERLIDVVRDYLPKNPAKTVRTVQHFCQQFVGSAPQSDDITLLALQYCPLNPFLQVPNSMKWSLTLNSDLVELEKVKQNLGEILQAEFLSVESIEDAQLIAEELLVNIIEYGYYNRSDGLIDLRLEMDEDRLKMTFIDGGKPFNPLTEISTPNLSDDERTQGGFGFFLVQKLAQEIDYAYLDNKNVLTVSQLIAKTS